MKSFSAERSFIKDLLMKTFDLVAMMRCFGCWAILSGSTREQFCSDQCKNHPRFRLTVCLNCRREIPTEVQEYETTGAFCSLRCKEGKSPNCNRCGKTISAAVLSFDPAAEYCSENCRNNKMCNNRCGQPASYGFHFCKPCSEKYRKDIDEKRKKQNSPPSPPPRSPREEFERPPTPPARTDEQQVFVFRTKIHLKKECDGKEFGKKCSCGSGFLTDHFTEKKWFCSECYPSRT